MRFAVGHQLSRTQRLVTRFVGPETAAAMEAHSRAWLVICPNCGHQRSIWELGGIRYKAVGESRNLMRCPACGKRGWHKLSKAANFPVTYAPALPLWRFIFFAVIAALIFGAILTAIVLAIVFTIIGLG